MNQLLEFSKTSMSKTFLIIMFLLVVSNITFAQHPCLTLTEVGVANVRSGLGNTPLFDQQLASIKAEVDEQIKKGINLPIPKDMGGGHSHEQHKYNYKLMHMAGNLYQFLEDDKYAEYVKTMLLEYAEMYPDLPLHPTQKSYSTGKLFWQCLNEANWLMFTSQAYDCIYDYLSESERKLLEQDLFVPFANFLSEENPRFFNRIHNHSTWANAAVGMIALAMKNDTLLKKALYGLNNDAIDVNEQDNDGGFIKKEGISKAGFLAQLDYSFSPDGYFTEGPYYQRYAILPFLVFSHALHNNKPELKIFEYRDEILRKATSSLLQLTDPQGNFFPFNDAQKGMNFKAYEIVAAVDLMYFIKQDESSLLNWAAKQNSVAFNEAGFYMAQQLQQKKLQKDKISEPVKSPVVYGDGVDGEAGAVTVLRMENTTLFFKFASHGMGHGHYDRLSYGIYDEAGEIMQDYGAVRWVNIEQKGGGRYLPENKTFGKQTIGHNTAVVNQKSQFGGKIKLAEKDNPELYFVDLSDPKVQVVSAIENNAYANVNMQRTVVLMNDPLFVNPIILDLFALSGSENIDIDLPFWYGGHIMKTSFECKKDLSQLKPLGDSHGYQHIWHEATSTIDESQFQFNWFGNDKFYTLTSASEAGDKIILGRAGANDPNFNLRSDPVLIHRKKESKNALYFNIIESHGNYSKETEIPNRPYSEIKDIRILYSDTDYIVTSFSAFGHQWEFCFAQNDSSESSVHNVSTDDLKYNWTGVYKLTKSKNI